jgi:hypothetical protein
MLAIFKGRPAMFCMKVIRRKDSNDIDVISRNQFSVVGAGKRDLVARTGGSR